jgi:hypothetical protein
MPCEYDLVPIDEIPAGDFEAMKTYFNTKNTSGKTFYVKRNDENNSCYILGTYEGTAKYTTYTTLKFSKIPFTAMSMGGSTEICTGPAQGWFWGGKKGNKKGRKTVLKKRRRTKRKTTRRA